MTILHELEWLTGAKKFDEDCFFNLPNGVIDPSLKSGQSPQPLDVMSTYRDQTLKTYFERIRSADLVIITLGMIECWYDTKHEMFLNQAPHGRVLKAFPARYEFVRLDIMDVLNALSKIKELLEKLGVVKIVVTTSPVALGRTFTSDDVIVANCLSKSTLRVAAQLFAESNTGVDYFPSYESVIYGQRELAWQSDFGHASDYIVSQIIEAFLSRYVEDYIGSNIEDMEQGCSEQQVEIKKLVRQVDRYKNLLIKNDIPID
jgi:hypothetical protein